MYCSACGTTLAPGLSYCNRCGMSLKEPTERKQTGAITAFLTAIALTLSREAHLNEDLVGFFMLFTFLIVIITEIWLVRQLSRLTATKQLKAIDIPPAQAAMPGEFGAPQARSLAEPGPSVTENTTRTLAYSRNEPSR